MPERRTHLWQEFTAAAQTNGEHRRGEEGGRKLRFEILTAAAPDRRAWDGCFTRTVTHCLRQGLNDVPTWPEYGRLDAARAIWEICEVAYRDEPEFESGQVVVDKARCWEALQLALHDNEHSDFSFRHVHGDKETFHLGFLRAGQPFAMPARGIHSLPATMCQHDFRGRRLFQHRNLDKWRLDGSNPPIEDFWFEDVCRTFLDELRGHWSGRVFWNPTPDAAEAELQRQLAGKTFRYTRVGSDSRPLELQADGMRRGR